MEEQIRQILADVLGLDATTIDGSTSTDNTESWDSLAHINIVSALEQEYGITLDIDEIESMQSLYDIMEILDRKL